MKRYLLIAFFILLADQILKFWIKLNMKLGEDIVITDWFIIHFTENPGMAFGFELGGDWGKLLLSVFRIITVIFIYIWMRQLHQKKIHPGGMVALTFILAGALGNIIDSAFYGLIFGASTYQEAASLFPEAGGYAPFLFGKVVDMFYFPLYKGYLPEWIPVWGGDYFVFFRPVFNLADAAISSGVGLLLIFQKSVFAEDK